MFISAEWAWLDNVDSARDAEAPDIIVKGAAPAIASANAQSIVHYLVTTVPTAGLCESAGRRA